MNAFEYASPATVKEAVALLGSSWGDTEVLAGGTDLLALMKDDIAAPKRLVSLRGIRELTGIRESPEGLRIGALTTLEELLAYRAPRERFTALAEAAEGVASPQIRNMGTVGGDLLQRPRCWYYRAGFGLLARGPDGKSLVPGGENRYHSIFGNSGPAYFVSPSSLAPALVTLDATVRLIGPADPREIPVERLFVVPQSDGEREHSIAPNEVLTEIIIPGSSSGFRSATYEVRQKEALDWPLATASVAVRMNGSQVERARIVLGHVAPIPWPATEAEKFLEGKMLDQSTAAQAGAVAVRGAAPLSGNAYKVQLARVSVARALLAAAGVRGTAKGA